MARWLDRKERQGLMVRNQSLNRNALVTSATKKSCEASNFYHGVWPKMEIREASRLFSFRDDVKILRKS
jgi:hypothetical protein